MRSGRWILTMRGTSGDLRHPRCSRYRCSLPGLAGFAGPRCTEPEAPRSGSRSSRLPELSLTHESVCLVASPKRTKKVFRLHLFLGRVGWNDIGRINPVHFERAQAMNLYDARGFAKGKVFHLFRDGAEVADVHRLQTGSVEFLAHADLENAFQHRGIFIRGMPMRRNLRACRAAQPDHEWRAICVHVAAD